MTWLLLPWLDIQPPDERDDQWWWYCLCTGYDGEPTYRQALAAGHSHAQDCDKAAFRWAKGWEH